jgi:hypothetical protein
MPFHNVTGDKALEPWQKVFARRVSTSLALAQPFRFDVTELEEVVTALTNSGWRMEDKVTTDLADKVSAVLRCSTVVLGEFSRADGLWTVKVRIVRPGGAEAERTFQIEDRSTHQLLLQMLEKTCATMEVTPVAAQVSLMRDFPVSDSAWGRLLKLDAESDETSSDHIQALRDLLASEPNFFWARSRLARALLISEQWHEALAEGKKLVQQAPGLCAGHLVIAYSLQDSDPEQDKRHEEAFLAALQAHRGCPQAIRVLFPEWMSQERWEDIRRVGEEAHQALPTETSASAYLALARTKLGDRKAASQGNAEAQYELGVLLYEGKLIQKDEVEASQWMHLAAQRRDKNARSLLREMELFMDRTAFEAGRKRAAEFKPVTAVTGK